MNSACIVFLIDESAPMQQRIVEGSRSRMESIATAVNSTLRQMEGKPPVDVAIFGYFRDQFGQNVVASRWAGAFAGRTWVSSSELPQNPIRIETRTKHVVNPMTKMVTQETTHFPVWFEPSAGGAELPRIVAYEFLAQQLLAWYQESKPAAPPLVLSFLRDLDPSDSLASAVVPLGTCGTSLGYPVLFQFHPGIFATVPAIKYPSSAQFLPAGPVQEMFHSCSPLSEGMLHILRQNQEVPLPGAKGLVYNGRTIDLLRFMNLAKAYQSVLPLPSESAPAAPQVQPAPQVQSVPQVPSTPIVPQTLVIQPLNESDKFSSFLSPGSVQEAFDGIPPIPPLEKPSEPEKPANSEESSEIERPEIIPGGYEFLCRPFPENHVVEEHPDLPPRSILLVLLVDRSVTDLTYRPALECWSRRLDKTRFMLGEMARRGRRRYDVSIIFYGKNPDGTPEVVSDTLGREFLADDCLVESAGKVEPITIQVPNGIGGLIALPRKKLYFTEATPTYPADPVPAFQRVAETIRKWDAAREKKRMPPLVLHITAGDFQRDRFDEALGYLSGTNLPPIWLHHWVFTERPHVGVCCPWEMDDDKGPDLKFLWERTDPLPAREILAGIRPGIHEESRGMMVNMDFDILFEVIDTLEKKCEGFQN